MHRTRRVFACFLALTAPVAIAAAELPLAPTRLLEYEVSSGTFMSLAVSPDGKTILFDMLGELYALPASGGRARPIATGIAFETQPVFSPDGKWIAYVSDRSGGDNVWIARADGSDARRISSEDEGAVRTSPEWSADGKSVFVSRYRIRLDRYELWRHPVSGGEAELVTPARTSEDAPREKWQSTLGAAASRDGKLLYFARRVGDLSFDEPVQWTIIRRNLTTGAEETVIGSSGGREAGGEAFFRPAVSPDGRLLAYATRRMGKTFLRVRDLLTGVDRALGPAPLDLMNGAAWMDLIPRYTFTPDGKAILIAYEGKIERRPVNGSPATRIPFTAKLSLEVGPSTRIAFREATGAVRAKLPQGTTPSPDGKRVAFAALGSLYVQPLDGASVRLAIAGDPPSHPNWSPDGKRLTYVTWSESAGGAVWTIAADGSAAPVKVSHVSAFYTHPAFTPDGRAVLVVQPRRPHASRAASSSGRCAPVSWRRSRRQVVTARVVARGRLGQRPHFVAGQPSTAYLMSDDGLTAIELAGGERRVVAMVKGAGLLFRRKARRGRTTCGSAPTGCGSPRRRASSFTCVAARLIRSRAVDLTGPGNPGRRVTDSAPTSTSGARTIA